MPPRKPPDRGKSGIKPKKKPSSTRKTGSASKKKDPKKKKNKDNELDPTQMSLTQFFSTQKSRPPSQEQEKREESHDGSNARSSTAPLTPPSSQPANGVRDGAQAASNVVVDLDDSDDGSEQGSVAIDTKTSKKAKSKEKGGSSSGDMKEDSESDSEHSETPRPRHSRNLRSNPHQAPESPESSENSGSETETRRSLRPRRKTSGFYDEPEAFKEIEAYVHEQDMSSSEELLPSKSKKNSAKKRKVVLSDEEEDSDGSDVWSFKGSGDSNEQPPKATLKTLAAVEKERKPTVEYVKDDIEESSSTTSSKDSADATLAVDASAKPAASRVLVLETPEREMADETNAKQAQECALSAEDGDPTVIPSTPVVVPDEIVDNSDESDGDIVLLSTPPPNSTPDGKLKRPLPVIPPITPPKTPLTVSWTNSVTGKRKRDGSVKMEPIFGPQFVPKSNRPLFRMLHERRRDYFAQIPEGVTDDPLMHKVRAYDNAIRALSELDTEGIVLRDSRHAKELKRKGKITGWGESMRGHLDEVRRDEKEKWERDGFLAEGPADPHEIDGTMFAAELELEVMREVEEEYGHAPPPGPPLPRMSTEPNSFATISDPTAGALTTAIPLLPPTIARELVALGYKTIHLLRKGFLNAPTNPDGSVTLRALVGVKPGGGLVATVIPKGAAAWLRYLPELEKWRPAEQLVEIAEGIAGEIATVLGKEVKLDVGGESNEGENDGQQEQDLVRVAVSGAVRVGEPTSRELTLVVQVAEDPGEALGKVLESLQDHGMVLAVLHSTSAELNCLIKIGDEAEALGSEDEKQDDNDSDTEDEIIPTTPSCVLRLYFVGSPTAYAHSTLFWSIPTETAWQFTTRLQIRGYHWDGINGVFRRGNKANAGSSTGEIMAAETEDKVFEILGLERGNILRVT